MKIIRPTSTLEVKRCFVLGNLIARRTHKGHMKKLESPKHFEERVREVKAKVLKMHVGALDKIIGDEY